MCLDCQLPAEPRPAFWASAPAKVSPAIDFDRTLRVLSDMVGQDQSGFFEFLQQVSSLLG